MYPDDLKYTREHEWVRCEGDSCTVGITLYAADQLGDITYVELPEKGDGLSRGDEAGAVESVKAASDIYAPLSGTVSQINEELEDRPELVNESPFESGWFFKMSGIDQVETENMMDAEAYEAFVKELDH